MRSKESVEFEGRYFASLFLCFLASLLFCFFACLGVVLEKQSICLICFFASLLIFIG